MGNRDKLSITYATTAGYYPTLQTTRGRKKWAQKPNSINLNNLHQILFFLMLEKRLYEKIFSFFYIFR